jgi:glucose-1-phosphatase
MIRPEVVVFDLGKVLVDFDYSRAARRIAAQSQRSAAEVQALIDNSPLLFRYETGRLTREEFYREVCQATGFTGTLAEFCDYFSDVFTPMESMIALHASLRRSGYPTYIFSNTNDLAIAHIQRSFPFFAHFNDYVYSFEHGAMKPEAKLYEVVERVTGREGAAILYLDDRIENVEAGRRRGWQTIHQQSPAASAQRLHELELLSPDTPAL